MLRDGPVDGQPIDSLGGRHARFHLRGIRDNTVIGTGIGLVRMGETVKKISGSLSAAIADISEHKDK